MSSAELKTMLDEMQSENYSGMGVYGLLAYARMTVAVYNLVTTGDFEEEYGEGEKYLQRSYSIVEILMQHYENEYDRAKRGEILLGLFYQLHGTEAVADSEQEAKCYALAADYIEEYLKRYGAGDYTSDEQFVAVKIMFVCLYGVVADEDKDMCEWYEYIRKTLAGWVAEAGDNGRWSDVPVREEIQRLILLNMNSYILLDDQYNGLIGKMLKVYQTLLKPSGEMRPFDCSSIRLMYLCYEASSNVVLPDAYPELSSKIANIFLQQSYLQPAGSEKAEICKSVVVENGCNLMLSEQQDRMMEGWS